jgi:uncharacterized protein (UPF0333 family)
MKSIQAINRPRSKYTKGQVEALPFKLIIIAVVMAVAIPLIYFGLQNYMRTQVENDISRELNNMISTIKQVYSGGNGSTSPVKVSFQNAILVKIEYIKIGDALGYPNQYRIRYKLAGEAEKSRSIFPNIAVTNHNGDGPLVLHADFYELIFTHMVYDKNGNNIIEAPFENHVRGSIR